jgi:hypothetical protein
MEQDLEKDVKEIMGGLTCPKDFECYRQRFSSLCKAEDVGLASHLICREERPAECNFSWDCGSAIYCTCPVRVYVSREFEK